LNAAAGVLSAAVAATMSAVELLPEVTGFGFGIGTALLLPLLPSFKSPQTSSSSAQKAA
jgi:hypothetical protein